jgi:hypothetical protein
MRLREGVRDAALGDATDERMPPGSAPSPRSSRWWTSLALVAVNVPIAVAAVRALLRGWQPVGDSGLLLVRAQDVGTVHNPLLGTWTSASLVLDQHLNNPGPLYSDVIAPPIKLLGPWVGLAVGVMLVNMAASTLAVVVARRISGTESMVAAAVVVAGLQWALGSELLFDVWQPNALVLPMMALLVVATVLATGDLTMAPWFAGLATLLVQTHLSYAPLVAGLTVGVVVRAGRAARRADTAAAWRRPLVWTVAILGAGWAQPVVEQLTGRGEGNLSRIAGAAMGGEEATVGLRRALRILAQVTVVGPWFDRSTYDRAVPPTQGDAPVPGLVALAPAALTLAAVAVVLVGLAVVARRLTDPHLTAMVRVSTIALAAGLVALAWSPVNITGLAVHGMRWLWPVAALATATVLTCLLAGLRTRPAWARRATTAGVALALVTALANLPTHTSRSWGPALLAPDLPAAQELVAGLDALEDRGTVLFDPTGLRYGEPYSGLVLAEMQDRGISFVVDDEGMIRQLGEGRRHRGDAALRLWQVEGDTALHPPPGTERVAVAEGLLGPVALLVEPNAGRSALSRSPAAGSG